MCNSRFVERVALGCRTTFASFLIVVGSSALSAPPAYASGLPVAANGVNRFSIGEIGQSQPLNIFETTNFIAFPFPVSGPAVRVKGGALGSILFRVIDIDTRFANSDHTGEVGDFGSPFSALRTESTSVGFTASFDTRDRPYAPTHGQFVQAEFSAAMFKFFRSNRYNKGGFSYDRYDRLADNLVLAERVSYCHAGGKVPVFDLCLFGASNDLRGLASGRYRDKAMVATQTELRWQRFKRLGFVTFIGAGSVASSVHDLKSENILASVGAGVRFLASPKYGVNIAADGAITKRGDTAVSLRIGEAF